MKLLLTSAGLTNKTIIQSLKDLVERQFEELSVAFIPTAANVENVDKWWVVEDMQLVQKLGWKYFDIVDFSALPQTIWKQRLERADVIVVGGGSSFHLMECINSLEDKKTFIELLKQKVYVGLSAGSMITSEEVQFGWDRDFYGIPAPRETGEGLGFVNFYVMPHLGVEDFSKVTEENISELAKQVKEPIYLLDNDSAIVVIDEETRVVSEGTWKKFN